MWKKWSYYKIIKAVTVLTLALIMLSHLYATSKFGSKFGSRFSSSIAHPAYTVMKSFVIKEYGITATLFNHKKSGAEVMSIATPDDNKVFGISFRTPPKDSMGIPHILEHSVLCGSRKYPVKEPFVDLLKGSLQNFLNAFTYPDRTCYPVASTNTKDFYNLVNVYLDAVLHPKAMTDPLILQQEGWHYELDDAQQPLSIKGVVYNEMKGVYSSPDSLVGREIQHALFPDNTYGVDSGGDPEHIPELSYKQFRAFHDDYYHPANSKIFFYGNDDQVKRLELLDTYLNEFDARKIDSKVAYQQAFSQPRQLKVKFPLSAEAEQKEMMSVNWILNHAPLTMKESLAWSVLDSLLLGTPSSSLRKILTESQLGDSLIGDGLSDELIQSTFSVGLKGIKPSDSGKVEAFILSAMTTVCDKGFSDDEIAAAINTLEFKLREFNTGGFPKGLSLMLGMLPNWIYDKNPMDGVRFDEALVSLKQDVENGVPVFQNMLRVSLLQNQHRVTAHAVPDTQLEARRDTAEKSRLETIKKGFSQIEIEDIVHATKALKDAQLREDSPEVRATLPKLTIDDIDKRAADIPIVVKKLKSGGSSQSVISHNLETSGILYCNVLFDFSELSMEDIAWLPLFSRMIKEAGTETLDEVTISRKIGTHTGGISASLHTDLMHVAGAVADSDDALLYFTINGKAVQDKVPIMLEIMTDLLKHGKLDNQRRAVEILRESKAKKTSSVVSAGHSFGLARLAGRHSMLGYLGEKMSGLTSVRESFSLLAAAENDWPATLQRLKKIRDVVVKKNNIVVNLTGNDDLVAACMPSVEQFIAALPTGGTLPHSDRLQSVWKARKQEFLLPIKNEGFAVPSQVNYVVKGGVMIDQGQPVSGSSSVVTRHLSRGYLWDNVRVVGGAYGGFGQLSEASGRFSFASYRDPNLVNTLNIYDGAATALAQPVSDESLTQSIIGTIGDLDSPMSADQKGFVSLCQYLTGETHQDQQKWRDEVLATSQADFATYAHQLQRVVETGSVVVFGSQSALEQANKEIRGAPLEIESAFSQSDEAPQVV